MEVLVINGHDYSKHVQRKGVGWSRNDIDSEKTTRTKDGKMRRDKITTKRKLSYTMTNMKQEQMSQLDDDLSAPTCSVKYLDLHGVQARTFCCSSTSATLAEVQNGDSDVWEGMTFNLTEV